jgi:hypothetical protein
MKNSDGRWKICLRRPFVFAGKASDGPKSSLSMGS